MFLSALHTHAHTHTKAFMFLYWMMESERALKINVRARNAILCTCISWWLCVCAGKRTRDRASDVCVGRIERFDACGLAPCKYIRYTHILRSLPFATFNRCLEIYVSVCARICCEKYGQIYLLLNIINSQLALAVMAASLPAFRWFNLIRLSFSFRKISSLCLLSANAVQSVPIARSFPHRTHTHKCKRATETAS